jgi:hypothetical protein
MQPGPSDADLEKPRLERLQGFGLVFVLFFVVWIPLIWLYEPSTNLSQENQQLAESVDRGASTIALYSEENQAGIGCVRCHGESPPLSGGQNLFNGNIVAVPNLRTVCAGPNLDPPNYHPLIHNIVDVKNTIMQGRPGTDMPSWSVRFAGSLDDQQVQDILDYIISVQDPKLVKFGINVCINTNAPGYQAPVVPAE